MQQTLSENGFEKFRKKTRKEQFLEEMETLISWKELAESIKPFYPHPKGAGCPSIGIERMLRIHFLQHWFTLSDPAAEEALYDSRGVDSATKIIHSVVATPASVHDSQILSDLLHGGETRV